MKLHFSGRTIDFPGPVPGPDECVLSVDKIFDISPEKAGGGHRNLTFFNLAKVAFFALREGPSLTLSKIRAVLAHRKLGQGRRLVIAVGVAKESGNRIVAIGGQDCPDASELCFAKALALDVADSPMTEEDIVGGLAAFCQSDPTMAAAIRDWSRFSGMAPPVAIRDALASAGDALTSPKELPLLAGRDGLGDWRPTPPAGGETALFLAGGGTYPCAYALPIFKRAGIVFDTVIELNPVRAAQVAERFGFAYADTDARRGLERLSAFDWPILVIATYHSTHIDIAEAALAINPNTRIMLEKPPVTTFDQLRRLEALRQRGAYIEIGFNRRHIPMSTQARDILARETGPVVVTCIVKELVIPASHWYHWPAQGTRITGNVCHWLDLGNFFISGVPLSMSILGPVAASADDGVTIVVRYDDGSRLHIVATDRGSSLRGVQEIIELRRADTTIFIDDFMRMRVQSGARQRTYRHLIRDKGHKRMYARFMDNVRNGAGPGYPDEDLRAGVTQYLRASDIYQAGTVTAEIDLTAPSEQR